MTATLTQNVALGVDGGTTGSVSASLGSPATAGNLLVAAVYHRSSGAVAEPTVDQGMQREVVLTTPEVAGGNKGVALFWKVAEGGEETFTTGASDRWQAITVAEYQRSGGFSGAVTDSTSATTGATASTSLTADVFNPGIVESFAFVATMTRGGSDAAYDSGFSANLPSIGWWISSGNSEGSYSWRNDASTVPGDNVTVSHSNSVEKVMVTLVVSLAAGATPLATPTGFTFTAHGSLRQLNGTWDAVPNAATYEAQVDQETSPGTWTNLTTYSGAATSFQLTDADGVDWATTYRSRVRAHPPE